jgi:hypothetical protein
MTEREDVNIKELHERAELAHADRALAPVSLTMAFLAVSVAVASMVGRRAHEEVLLAQTRANFQKAELVGNATQQHTDALLIELLGVLSPQASSEVAALKSKFSREMERYATQQEQASAEERRLASEGQNARRRANRFDAGELFCEMALVLCSITLLTRRRSFWFAGLASGALGLAMAMTGLF